MDTLRALLYGVSAQRPSHSLFIAGEQLPLEARMGGIFLGFAGGVLFLLFLGRLRATGLPLAWPRLGCTALILLTGLDGLNAVLADVSRPHLYEPNTVMRLSTGLGAGYGLALLALPAVAASLWPAASEEPNVMDLVEWAFGLAAVALVGGLLLTGAAPLLWPAALAMAASVVVGFGAANVTLLRLLPGRPSTAPVGRLIAAGGLAMLEIGLLASLRTWLLASYGFTWGL
jgi:uncharacterized membrane protein